MAKAKNTKKKTAKKAARKTTKTKTAKKAKNQEALYVASKVKSCIKDGGMNMASDALEGLNNQIHWLISQATARAELNGRKTVRSHDFLAQ